jgi:hypothetical protein
VLLSIEYPIAAIACPEHDDEVAFNAKGEETWDPLIGDVTVTLEKAGAAQTIIARLVTVNKYFIRCTSTSPSAETACKIPLSRGKQAHTSIGAPALSVQIYSTRNLWIDDLKLRDYNFSVNPKNADSSALRDHGHL